MVLQVLPVQMVLQVLPVQMVLQVLPELPVAVLQLLI
jgi:hypothetical protein